jgi:outer membrane biosynthesis protein TonB
MTAAEIFEPRPDETVAPATAGGLASVDTPKPTPRMDPKLNPAPAPTPPPVAKPPVATIAPPPAPEPADIPEPATSVAPVENIQEAMKAREAKTTPPPESDSLQIKRGIVNAIEGLALDLDLNLSNLYDMLAIVAENRATTKLVDCSIPQLVTLKARLEKTARERKAAPATK